MVILEHMLIEPQIYSVLHQLGASSDTNGYFFTAYAVHLAVGQPERLMLVTKWLYPEVARHYDTTWKNVERNIRTAISIIWDTNPKLLEALVRHPLPRKPKASEFLSVLAAHFSLEPEDDRPSQSAHSEGTP